MEKINSHIAEASLAGLFKTVLVILGAFVLLRFLGQLMIAKRNIEEERADLKREKDFVRERNRKMQNFGKVSVTKEAPRGDIQDVDYEEVG